jgi:pyruvate-formate lyase
MKFGLSSPGYIIMGKLNNATFDGRLDKEPYSIHISADDSNNVTELINFASKLDYGKHGFNGNVVDFTMASTFIKENQDKFIQLMKSSITVGVFQMQMNVIDSKTLIEAKKNPAKFPNLIVRVWGFSAYFKDLPIEYQDYVIERALKNEAINY